MIAVSIIFVAATARAGDPEAHSTAMIQAATNLVTRPEYFWGVGAPVNKSGGLQAAGKFRVDISGSKFCPYTPQNPYGVGCAYDSDNGLAINEPDDWNCIDPDQPERINELNHALAPNQGKWASDAAARVSEFAMACNWNHFTANPALIDDGNSTGTDAYEIVRDWGEEIVLSIEENGATDEWACDVPSWDEYYERAANASHFKQDAVAEHHDHGNEVCDQTTTEIWWSRGPIQSYKRLVACMDWLNETVNGIVGPRPPPYSCDQAIVNEGTPDTWWLNGPMAALASVCGVYPTVLAGFGLPAVDTTPNSTIACMGFERVLRHHCVIDRQKSLDCTGAKNDHSIPGNQYCEGESYSGGGEDFLAAATAATEPVLIEAFDRWADVCKEPDDPCSESQCTTWCKRTVGLYTNGADTQGYCINNTPDPDCVRHTCECGDVETCGGVLEMCCASDVCGDGLECDGATGYCFEKGTAQCEEIPFRNGDFTEELTYWSGGSAPEPLLVANECACKPAQSGNNFAYMGVWGGGYGHMDQTFDVPEDATQMTVRTWNALDPAMAVFSIIDEKGVEIPLGSYTPVSIQKLEDPEDLYSVVCVDKDLEDHLTFPIDEFAGERVTLRLAACCGPGYNGVYIFFDDVTIE